MILSKTTYLAGLKCPKFSFLKLSSASRKQEFSPERAARFVTGDEVGLLFRDYMDGGYDLSQNGILYGQNLVEPTIDAVKKGHTILYEATFLADGSKIKYFSKPLFDGKLLFAADAIVISESKIKIYEAKSSTYLKIPSHIYELGFM